MIFATVQVRMGSSRLPGKVMMEVAGKPMLGHLLDRLAHCRRLDGVVVATSTRPENQAIADYCRRRGTPCFRGDEDDVLGRMLGAVNMVGATVGVEVFGDSPLVDPALIDGMICQFLETGGAWDFIGNDLKTTYPPGQEVEVFSVSALHRSGELCSDPAIREHGTLFIRQNPALFRVLNIEAPPKFNRPTLEMEVDTAEDMSVLEAVLEHFAGRSDFGLGEIIAFLEGNPDIAGLNAHVERRWKQYRTDAAASDE